VLVATDGLEMIGKETRKRGLGGDRVELPAGDALPKVGIHARGDVGEDIELVQQSGDRVHDRGAPFCGEGLRGLLCRGACRCNARQGHKAEEKSACH
jgi:hypothetical protein